MFSSLLLIAALAAPSPPGTARSFTGIARAHAGGRVLYRERHIRYGPPGHRREVVLYSCPDGKPFARKILGGGDGSAQAPDFGLVDGRSGYREGVHEVDGRRMVYVHRVGADQVRSAPLPKAGNPVIDGGIDAFLHAHWKALVAGRKVSLSFLVPSRRKFMDFEIYRRKDAQAANKGEVEFRLRLSSWFGFVLPHIDVAYSADTRQLLWFRGLSNIRDMRGKNVTVELNYPPGLREQHVPASDIQAARTAPLDGRCTLH